MSDDFNGRLEKLDVEVREARDIYINNDNPARDEKLKEVWEKTMAQRESLQAQVVGLLDTKQKEELEEMRRRLVEIEHAEPPAKKAKKDGQKDKDDQTGKAMPYMKSVDSISQLWNLWEVGHEDGLAPISLLADRSRRERGFNRQRFHEWSTVASEIQQQAYAAGTHPRQRAEELELDRKAVKASMPQYAKMLMAQYKERRSRFQPLPAPAQDRFAALQLPAEGAELQHEAQLQGDAQLHEAAQLQEQAQLQGESELQHGNEKSLLQLAQSAGQPEDQQDAQASHEASAVLLPYS